MNTLDHVMDHLAAEDYTERYGSMLHTIILANGQTVTIVADRLSVTSDGTLLAHHDDANRVTLVLKADAWATAFVGDWTPACMDKVYPHE